MGTGMRTNKSFSVPLFGVSHIPEDFFKGTPYSDSKYGDTVYRHNWVSSNRRSASSAFEVHGYFRIGIHYYVCDLLVNNYGPRCATMRVTHPNMALEWKAKVRKWSTKPLRFTYPPSSAPYGDIWQGEKLVGSIYMAGRTLIMYDAPYWIEKFRLRTDMKVTKLEDERYMIVW
jgi:hypothetical protein